MVIEKQEQLLKIYDVLNKQRFKFYNVSDVEFEDLVQNTIVSVLEKNHNNKNIEAFALTILKHKYIDYYRKYNNKYFVPYDNNIKTENYPNKENELRLLRKSILKLKNHDERACLLLHYRGLKYNEIADGLDMCLSNVKSNIRRAKQKLLKKLN